MEERRQTVAIPVGIWYILGEFLGEILFTQARVVTVKAARKGVGSAETCLQVSEATALSVKRETGESPVRTRHCK